MTATAPAVAGDMATTGERKLLTLLFVDLSGYTRMTATRDPEDVRATVAPLLAGLRRIAEEHGGDVSAVQGDGFLAVYGAPTAHTDDARRAVATAVAMRSLVAAKRLDGPETPDIHIGVASGEVLVTPGRAGQDVVGASVNLAARLSDAAGAGVILVDESTAAMTAKEAVYGTPQPLDLAGFIGRVRAHPLLRLERRRFDDQPVARDAQIASLDRAFERAQTSSSTHVVAVTGEAGLGKSSLVESWIARQPGLLALRGGCRPYGSPLPLSALTEALSAAPDLPDAEVERQAYLRLLPRGKDGSPREPDAALAVAARRLLAAIARQGATVVVLDDVHWGDAALLELVRGLHADPLPGVLLVVVTSREQVAGLPEVALSPLASDDIARVVENRLGAPPGPGLLHLLVEHSAGNPLWLVECLSLLSDRGELAVESGLMVARKARTDIEVPTTIRMIVAARVDSLPASQKHSLQRASVWPVGLPRTQWPGETADLEALEHVGLLRRGDNDAVRFSHGLVREAVYRSMPRAARVAEHESVLAISTDAAARAYSAAEVQRLDVAPDPARRVHVGEQALQAAVAHAKELQLSHTRAACDVLLRATALVDELDGVVPGACSALLVDLARLLHALEDVTRSREIAERALALGQLSGDGERTRQAELTLAQSLVGSDNAAARELGERLADDEAATPAIRAAAWHLLSGTWVYDDMAQALSCLEKSYAWCVAAGDAEEAASVARELAWNLSVTAGPGFEHWYDIAVQRTAAEHQLGQGELSLISAVVESARGNWEESWEAAMRAATLNEQVGMHRSHVDALAVAVNAATATGRREALPALLVRLAAASEGHRARLQVTALCSSAPALMLLGRGAEAHRALDRAASLTHSVGPNEAIMLWVARAQLEDLSGRPVDAAAAWANAESLAESQQLTLFAYGCRLQRMAATRECGQPLDERLVLDLASQLELAGAAALADKARGLLG